MTWFRVGNARRPALPRNWFWLLLAVMLSIPSSGWGQTPPAAKRPGFQIAPTTKEPTFLLPNGPRTLTAKEPGGVVVPQTTPPVTPQAPGVTVPEGVRPNTTTPVTPQAPGVTLSEAVRPKTKIPPALLGPDSGFPKNDLASATEASTSVFGIEATGRKFVYVFDRSASMDSHHGAPLAAAKAQLVASLQPLEPLHQFQIIFYSNTPRVFNPSGVEGRLVFASPANKKAAERFVSSIKADGGTQHFDALMLALQMQPDVIFFLTDAEEPPLTDEELKRLQDRNGGAIVHTIQIGYEGAASDGNFLQRLAQQNGGKYVYLNAADLPASGNPH